VGERKPNKILQLKGPIKKDVIQRIYSTSPKLE
jgi:hypothetical protein